MAKQALNGRERQKPQRTYKMWVSSVDFTCKMFIFRNIYRCKSTIFRSPYYSINGIKILNGSSRNLTPRHTMHDAFMNFNSGKSRLLSSRRGLGHLCLNVRILRANGNSKFLPKPPMTKRIPFPHNQHSHHRMLNRLLKWRKKNSDVNTVFIVTLLNIVYIAIISKQRPQLKDIEQFSSECQK